MLPSYRKNSNKVPVVAVVERGGHVRTKVVPNVTQNNVGRFLFENIENGTIVNTDQSRVYHTILYPITKHLGIRHEIVNHSKQKYTERNEDGTTSGVNCAESFFSLIKRGLLGTFHAVSKEHFTVIATNSLFAGIHANSMTASALSKRSNAPKASG